MKQTGLLYIKGATLKNLDLPPKGGLLRHCLDMGDLIARSGIPVEPVNLSTPPVENSNPERVAPQGADGQGVCTIHRPLYILHVTWPSSVVVDSLPNVLACDSAAECVTTLNMAFEAGATSVTVESGL